MTHVTKVRTPKLFDPQTPNMKDGPYFVVGAFVHPYSHEAVFNLARIKKDGNPSAAPVGQNPKEVFILPEDNEE